MKPRKTHKNRFSITHLSTDTTATLPEYVPASQNLRHRPRVLDSELEGLPSDQPPGYPDSADEADEETDSITSDNGAAYPLPPLLPPPPAASLPTTPSPRRHVKRLSTTIGLSDPYSSTYQHYTHPYRHQTPNHFRHPNLHHRRLNSSMNLPCASPTDDPYLDSLLARSVHALEMSNSLLQSTISTQESLSALLKTPTIEREEGGLGREESLDKFELRAKGLTKKIQRHEDRREHWVDDLEKIKRDVEILFSDQPEEAHGEMEDRWVEGSSTARGRDSRADESTLAGVSCSLPTSSSSMSALRAHKRRPSQLDLQNSNTDSEPPRLTYSSQYRSRLISPAPRAVTQYIAAPSVDSGTITLPSTLGMRTSSTFLNHPSTSASTPSFHSSSPLMPPQVIDKSLQPTTPAYTMLASFVHRTPGETASTPSSFTTPSVLASLMPKMRPRASSSVAAPSSAQPKADAVFRGKGRSSTDGLRSLPSTRTSSAERTRGRSPKSPLTHRAMTPPTEESTGSSSSSESLIAKKTVMSLRKILDEQPLPARSTVSLVDATGGKKKLKAPAFIPFTPVPAPQASTSNATASVSRLFTKSIHTSSTRPPSLPRQSALKHGIGSRSSISAMDQTQSTTASTSSGPGTAGSSRGTNGTAARLTHHNVAKAPLAMLPELVSAGVAKALGGAKTNSASTSGRSTPKRISFAELPDMERPEGRSSKFKEKQAQRKRRRSNGMSLSRNGNDASYGGGGSGGGSSAADPWENGSPPGWWSGWLGDANDGGIGGAMAGMGGGNGGMYVSRLEERVAKPWSGAERPGFGFGDWAV